MKTFWAIATTEWRLAWRRPSFWVVQGVLLLTSANYLFFHGGGLGSFNPGGLTLHYVSEQLYFLNAVLLLLLPLLLMPSLLRDQETVGDLLWTTPLGALSHGLGVTLGLLLGLLPLLAVQLLARWLLLMLAAEAEAPGLLFVYGPPLLAVSLAAGLGLLMLLVNLLRRPLAVLLLWLPLWLITVWLSRGITTTQPLPLQSPLNLFFHGLDLSPSVGVGLAWPLVQGLALWFFGLGLVGFSLALLLGLCLDKRKATRQPLVPVLLLGLAAVLALGAYASHRQAVLAQLPSYSPRDNGLDLWQVTHHRLEADVDAARGRLSGHSSLTLTAEEPLERLVLGLNPGLTVLAVQQDGEALLFERLGDSVSVALSFKTGEVAVELFFEGRPQVPYADYGFREGYSMPAMDTPQAVRGLLARGAGYLLRDGDWYPWPWSTLPRQAEEALVALSVAGNGVVRLSGVLPPALLVLPPERRVQHEELTLHLGHGAGRQLLGQVIRFAEAVPRLWQALGDEPPRHLVVLPYLEDIIWSGDVLLVPESYRFHNAGRLRVAYEVGSDPLVAERATASFVARAWLNAHAFVPKDYAWAPAADWNAAHLDETSEGRWIDTSIFGPSLFGREGRTAQVARDVLAFWLAIELAPDEVRHEDLALLRGEREQGEAQYFALEARRLPYMLAARSDLAALIVALADWAERVGRDHALGLFADTYKKQTAFDLDALMAELMRASGVPLNIGNGGAYADND